MKRVVIADDHPIMLSGIEAILQGTKYQVVARASSGRDALSIVSAEQPDLLLMDVQMPNGTGLDVLRTLRADGSQLPVVLLTASLDDQGLVEAVDLGANGVLLKEGAENLLMICLEEVFAGRRWIERSLLDRALNLSKEPENRAGVLSKLSNRESEVVRLVACGKKNKDIALKLGISEGTVKVYLHKLYQKLGIENRTQLAMLANNSPRQASD